MRRAGVLVVVIAAVASLVVVLTRLGEEDWASSCASVAWRPDDAVVRAAQRAREVVGSVSADAVAAVEVVDLAGCAELAAVAPEERFASASLVKLLIALDVLDRTPDVPDETRRRLRLMLSASDDDVASELWTAGGGPEIVRRTAGRLGLRGTRPPERPGLWGATTTTARDVGLVYRHVVADLPAGRHDLLVDALAAASRTASDGFDQHFGVPAALAGPPLAVKQGWGARSGRVVVHSSGLVGGSGLLAVVVLTSWPPGTDWAVAVRAVTAATRALDPVVAARSSALPGLRWTR
ncbi:hypothetical protein [Umezawaea beigongshangensis]|uniref:hypothetical protein n=1 Tax=Umezawaea beigongshangensis TaxID=2780383 RepID=UPI0018F1C367|nr:hypothetical protein [Umezawaea beigongshangensis]